MLEREATASSSGTTHHVKEHFRTDIHARAALHRETAALLREHFAGVDEVFAAVVAFTFFGIAERFVRFSDILESLRGALVLGVFVRVVHDCQFPVRFLDFVVGGVLFHCEDLVVVFAFRFLEFELGVADLLGDTRLVGVRFGNGFVFVDGGLPVTGFAEGAGFGFAGFGVGRVEAEGAGAV